MNFYSDCIKFINYYDNIIEKALFGFVIETLNFLDYCLVAGVNCSYGNVTLFFYFNNEIGKRDGYWNSV